MNAILENIKILSDLPGVSGDETAVRDWIISQIDGKHSYTVDPLGNLIVHKKGQAPQANQKKIMLSAHMDEVGFIITHIEESGLLRFAPVGGIDSRVVTGKSVEVGAQRIYGVIGTKAVHQAKESEREKPLEFDKLYIDIGAESADQARELVRPGDRALFYSRFQQLGSDKIMARALDDRAGCGILLALLDKDLPCDVHCSFTVQEETGCTGAITAGYTVQPDIGIIIETTTASDIAGVSPDKVVCKLGDGPVLSFMDRGTVYSSELYNKAMDIAKSSDIPAQAKEGIYGGNESRSVQVARGGAKVLAVSLPCRYLHSPSNVIDMRDVDSTLLLLEKLITVFTS